MQIAHGADSEVVDASLAFAIRAYTISNFGGVKSLKVEDFPSRWDASSQGFARVRITQFDGDETIRIERGKNLFW